MRTGSDVGTDRGGIKKWEIEDVSEETSHDIALVKLTLKVQ